MGGRCDPLQHLRHAGSEWLSGPLRLLGRVMMPFKVDRDGTVTHRDSGTIIGRVRLDRNDGWTAYGIGDATINRRYWNGRKYAAQAVWESSPFAAHKRQP